MQQGRYITENVGKAHCLVEADSKGQHFSDYFADVFGGW